MITNCFAKDWLAPLGRCAIAAIPAVRVLVILALAAASGPASPVLFGISSNGFGEPPSLVSMSAPSGPVIEIRSLGDGSVSYGGGLSWDAVAQHFFTFSSDSSGLLSLVSLTTTTGPDLVIPGFGYGLAGGLAYTGSALFGVVNDDFGNSTLLVFDLLAAASQPQFVLGFGFTGGLAWNPADNSLYAIQNDAFGESTLVRIDLTGQTTVPVKTLGFGFYGGLAIDPLTGLFWAIGSDSNAAGTLYELSSGPVPVAGASTGYGYLLASLSLGPQEIPAPAVPEPATIWLTALGGIGLLLHKHRQLFGKEIE